MQPTGSNEENFISKVHERSNRIVELAKEDVLNYPDNKFTYIPASALVIYMHVRIFASGFADIHNFDESPGVTTARAITIVSLQLDNIFRTGANKIAIDQGRNEIDVMATTPLAVVLDVGLKTIHEGKQLPKNSEVYFFIVALNDLLNFVDCYSASYKTASELRKASEREASMRATIDAMRYLSNAQMSLESGLQLMSTAYSSEKFKDQIKRAEEAEKIAKEREEIIKKSTSGLDLGRKKAAEAKKEKSKNDSNLINKAVDELFQNGEGWRHDNDWIVSFVQKRLPGLAKTTVRDQVKTRAAEIRKNNKLA